MEKTRGSELVTFIYGRSRLNVKRKADGDVAIDITYDYGHSHLCLVMTADVAVDLYEAIRASFIMRETAG